jgi:hypothetical protein
MIISGHLGSGTISRYTVEKDGVPFDLNTANIEKVQVVVVGFAMDSILNPNLVSFAGSTIQIKWGAVEKPQGGYSPSIYVYYFGDTEGTVLYGPGKDTFINLTLVEDERPVG